MNSKKEYEVKIKELEKEIKKLAKRCEKEKETSQILRKTIKELKRRISDLIKSRDNWKAKNKIKRLLVKELKRKIMRQGKAQGHQYSTWLITLCVLFRVFGNCSYGSISKILGILNSSFDLALEKLPCENTIQNWVSKMGLFTLQNLGNDLVGKKVTLIVDESIRLGQEKLLLILCVPFEKVKKDALSFRDVKVVYMKGAISWDGNKISEVVKQLEKTCGFTVKNILSDQDSKLLKATRLLQIFQVPDISHAIATCLRRTFDKTTDYQSFKKIIGGYLSKGVNQALSYLCPPKQRTKARFMNISIVIKWAQKMLGRFNDLNENELLFFKDLPRQQEIIAALNKCMWIANSISLPFKTEGISTKTLITARAVIKSVDNPEDYVQSFIKELEGYLSDYESIIKECGEINIHASSEIIESMFGKYKSKANNYALTGLTTLNLELPLFSMTKEAISEKMLNALEGISTLKIKEWKEEYSSDNQLLKRLKFFKKVA